MLEAHWGSSALLDTNVSLLIQIFLQCFLTSSEKNGLAQVRPDAWSFLYFRCNTLGADWSRGTLLMSAHESISRLYLLTGS